MEIPKQFFQGFFDVLEFLELLGAGSGFADAVCGFVPDVVFDDGSGYEVFECGPALLGVSESDSAEASAVGVWVLGLDR